MTPRLRSLLVGIGVATIAGVSAVVAIPKADVVRADLVDAGLADCPRRHLICDVRVSDEGRNVLSDAGITVTKRYVPMRVRGRLCDAPGQTPDKVLVLPVPPEGRDDLRALHINPDACEPVAADGRDLPAFEVAASRCVAAPASGTGCRRSEGDGGFRYFGAFNRMLRAESNGHASCIDVPCTVLAGETP